MLLKNFSSKFFFEKIKKYFFGTKMIALQKF